MKPRVVSLLPSATEIVHAVGAGPCLVGVSHECDFPEGARGLPVLTSSRVRTAGSSGSIDRGVRAVLRSALTVYDIDTAALRAARPDVIVTQDLCDVCAVSLADVQAAAERVLGSGVRIVNLHPTRLAEIFEDIGSVAGALGRSERGAAVVSGLRERVRSIEQRATATGTRPRVLTIEWIDPVMVGGTWMPELVALAGGEPLVTRAGQHAPTLGHDALRALEPAPDVVLVKPCGFELPRTLAELERDHAWLADMPWEAVRAGRVFAADGNAFFNRPGPRIVESLEILAACVHPDAFADFAREHAASFVRLDLARRT